MNWDLVDRIHRRGDRKEYFEAQHDVWQMFETIVRERRRREVQPIVETIERCLKMIDNERKSLDSAAKKEAKAFQKRFSDILEFCNLMNMLFHMMTKVGGSGLGTLTKRLGKLAG